MSLWSCCLGHGSFILHSLKKRGKGSVLFKANRPQFGGLRYCKHCNRSIYHDWPKVPVWNHWVETRVCLNAYYAGVVQHSQTLCHIINTQLNLQETGYLSRHHSLMSSCCFYTFITHSFIFYVIVPGWFSCGTNFVDTEQPPLFERNTLVIRWRQCL